MKLTRRRILIAIVTLTIAIIYLGGYVFARTHHWLVHRSAYDHGLVDNHSIAAGEFGSGLSMGSWYGSISFIVFTPLRWAETAVWYIREPAGMRWPHAGAAAEG